MEQRTSAYTPGYAELGVIDPYAWKYKPQLSDDEKCYLELLTDEKDLKFRICIGQTPFCVGRPYTSGRGECDNKEPIPHQYAYAPGGNQISRRHCQIELRRDPNIYLITDLGSANGTSVNGRRLQPNISAEIHDGDQIELGICRFIFKTGNGEAAK